MRRLAIVLAVLLAPLVAAPAADAAAPPQPTAWSCDVAGGATEGFSSLSFVSLTLACAGGYAGAPSAATYAAAMSVTIAIAPPCTVVSQGPGRISMTRTSTIVGSGPAGLDGTVHAIRVGLDLELSGSVSDGSRSLTLSGDLDLTPADPTACLGSGFGRSYVVHGSVTFTDPVSS
jgi:hypothetical protein